MSSDLPLPPTPSAEPSPAADPAPPAEPAPPTLSVLLVEQRRRWQQEIES